MRSEVLVYLAGPITATPEKTVEEHVASAVGTYHRLLKMGIPCICPHLNAGFPSVFTVAYETWLQLAEVLIPCCTHVLMLPGWPASKGAVREREFAMREDIPIIYFERDVEKLLCDFSTPDSGSWSID
ncbi:MAG TPA: DUF4406 domain-containing protein [Gemmatimonadales bacterium]